MQRIIIPTHYVHTRSTPLWTKELRPLSGAAIWTLAPAGVYPRLSVMQGAIRYLGYADETSPEPIETLTIEAGQFGVFPPENGTALRPSRRTRYLMSTSMLIRKFSSRDKIMNSENKGYTLAVENGRLQRKQEKYSLNRWSCIFRSRR